MGKTKTIFQETEAMTTESTDRELKALDLVELRQANIDRNKEWDAEGKIDRMFRCVEFAGEAGEVCNKLKKLERERLGLRGSRATKEELADELADSIITADLIGMAEGIDLTEAVIRVFNRKSDEMKLQRHLSTRPLRPEGGVREGYPEGCELVAHDTGEGWALFVEKDGETIAMLEWPYGERKLKSEELRKCGFTIT